MARGRAPVRKTVVDSDERTGAVPNLFITDGSVCATQHSANPTLTIMAMSSRLAERIVRRQVDAQRPARNPLHNKRFNGS